MCSCWNAISSRTMESELSLTFATPENKAFSTANGRVNHEHGGVYCTAAFTVQYMTALLELSCIHTLQKYPSNSIQTRNTTTTRHQVSRLRACLHTWPEVTQCRQPTSSSQTAPTYRVRKLPISTLPKKQSLILCSINQTSRVAMPDEVEKRNASDSGDEETAKRRIAATES